MNQGHIRSTEDPVEKNLAICYLYRDNDTDNCCILTNRRIKIFHRKRFNSYPFDSGVKISIERKKLLLPILAGGIIIPLTLSAYMEFALTPFATILIVLIGLVVFYLGWNGSRVLGITQGNQVFYFPFRQKNEGVGKFVKYASAMLQGVGGWRLYYFVPLKTEGREINDKLGFFVKNKDYVNVFDYNGITEQIGTGEFNGKDLIYIFDPADSSIRIQYKEKHGRSNIMAFFSESIASEDFLTILTVLEFKKKLKDPVRV